MLVACVLDEVAWLLNIRGSDVPNCPLPVSYATVELVPSAANPKAMVARPRLFVEDVKLGEEVKRHLQGANVEVGGGKGGGMVGVLRHSRDALGPCWLAGWLVVACATDPSVRRDLLVPELSGLAGQEDLAGRRQEQLRAAAGGRGQ